MVDANAAISASAIAGFGVNLGLGIRLTNGTVTPYITGMRVKGDRHVNGPAFSGG